MRKALLVLSVSLLTVATASAQDAGKRAWQQRLDVRIPITVPTIAVEANNPFSIQLDEAPKLLRSTVPKKVDVRGEALVAAYVDDRGGCLGAIPLEVPYAGISNLLVKELGKSRFDAARLGEGTVPSWAVVGVRLESRVKEATVRNQVFELPDPQVPNVPVGPTRMEAPGRLRNLPVSDPSALTSAAAMRRFRFRAAAKASDIVIVALVHVTAEGVCDQYVPLDMDAGMRTWFETFMGTWGFEPGSSGGQQVDCWMVYTANLAVEMSSIKANVARVLKDRTYSPNGDSD
ncbi:MAG: hypothetical protein GY906_25025 [bacterium]|nr:hypothetical protein [bacterium]